MSASALRELEARAHDAEDDLAVVEHQLRGHRLPGVLAAAQGARRLVRVPDLAPEPFFYHLMVRYI